MTLVSLGWMMGTHSPQADRRAAAYTLGGADADADAECTDLGLYVLLMDFW